jgi:IS30 family transposase
MTAELVAAPTIQLLLPYKEETYTFTTDRGKEFEHHDIFTKALDCDY